MILCVCTRSLLHLDVDAAFSADMDFVRRLLLRATSLPLVALLTLSGVVLRRRYQSGEQVFQLRSHGTDQSVTEVLDGAMSVARVVEQVLQLFELCCKRRVHFGRSVDQLQHIHNTPGQKSHSKDHNQATTTSLAYLLYDVLHFIL